MDIVSQVKQAIEYTKVKDYKSAEKIYKNLLSQDKDNTTILSLLGLLYFNAGKLKKAKTILTKSNKLNPNNPTTLEGLGFTFYNLGEQKEARKYFEQIIDKTKNFEVYENYINCLIDLRDNRKAYELSIKANTLFPLNKEIMAILIYACIYSGELNEAIKYSQQLLSAFPKYSKSWLRQGLVQEVIFHNEKNAQECYKTALKYGDKSEAYHNLAISYNKIGEYKKAEQCIKKVIKNDGLNKNNCFGLAASYFYQRKFKQGFKYYSFAHIYGNNDEIISEMKNFWNGKKYKNETLFVFCDQGIGDCIMFSRYFSFLENYFKKIKIACHPNMIELLKRSFKNYKKIKFYTYSKRFPKCDKMVIMSDLPYLLKITTSFPYSDKYMFSDEQKEKEYKEKHFNTEKLKVGVVWEAGAAGLREQLNRTLHISVLDEILKMEDIQFYSFQYKPTLDDYKNYDNLIDIGTEFKTFDDTASALKNLDVVITVDTSVAHLAGSLGVKTFMLLPYCPDWRWFDNTETTEWYDSMRIFKQTDHVFWDKEIEDIKTELLKLKAKLKTN